MPDRPDAAELIEAVFEFLAEEVLPNAPDHRAKFRTLVAMNALSIARRELDAGGPEHTADELARLAAQIRAAEPPGDALAVLKEHVAAKVRISNPAYLEKYE